MRICVIGTGVQGSAIALTLTKTPEVSEIVCADINLDRVKRVVDKLGSDKVSMQRVDAGNMDDLLRALKGADAVINATLPRYNLNIMNAALKSGAHYVDLASDMPEDTIPKQLGLSDKFRDAELTAVVYQGGPFVMNVLVRYAADRLDSVDEIHLRFGWRPTIEEEEFIPTWSPVWCPEIALLEWTTPPAVYKNGKFKKVPMFSGVEEYLFPEPVGPVTVCFIDYEPVWTLPRFIKGVKYVDCKLSPDRMAGALIKMGFASDKPIEVKGAKVAPIGVLLALVPPPSEKEMIKEFETSEIDWFGCLLAEVKGEKAGEKITHTLYKTISYRETFKKFGTPWAEVAVPAVVTATMLVKGETKVRGVIPPEGLEPEPFLAKLAERGVTFQERVAKEIRT